MRTTKKNNNNNKNKRSTKYKTGLFQIIIFLANTDNEFFREFVAISIFIQRRKLLHYFSAAVMILMQNKWTYSIYFIIIGSKKKSHSTSIYYDT